MFARGNKAIGICDVCGCQWKLNKLKYEVLAGRTVKIRVCPDCYDEDNPRDRPQVYTARAEAIAVRDPRPDQSTDGMNSLGGWNPVLGVEIPVFPVADGFSMRESVVTAPRYILNELSTLRLVTETGELIWAEE